jgi:hypothetical protein
MLCQLSDLKTRLKIAEADVVDDSVLEAFIAGVSGRFASECNRVFDYSATATYDFRADEMNIVVDRYPIVSVTSMSLKATEALGFVAEATLPDYLVNGPRNIIELAAPLGTSREIARVTYAGGYVLPGGTVGTGQTALPDEIEQAAIEQCAFYYRNKETLGLAGVSGQGGSISKLATADLLPNVAAMLKGYERWRN